MKSGTEPGAAAALLKKLSKLRPTLGMVLGSGFHHVLQELEVDAEISYQKLPGFPPVGVKGHAGKLYIGWLGGTPTIILPIANHDDNQHAPNENLRLQNLWDGIETFAGLFAGLAR